MTTMTTEMPHERPWGNQIQPKETKTVRLLLQNIGRLDLMYSGSIKLAVLRLFIQAHQVDVCAITECNVDWRKVPAHLYPAEQTKYWWESSHWKVTHNTSETNDAAYQPGGTGIVIGNQLAHRAQWPGDNKVGLGRWCWAKLCGKNNKILHIVLAYQPCKSEGPLTMYQQHLRFWYKQKQLLCLWDKFLQDLTKEVREQWS